LRTDGRTDGRTTTTTTDGGYRLQVRRTTTTDGLLHFELSKFTLKRTAAALPEEKRRTRTNVGYPKGAPLLPSGLLGPLRILAED
jgi:hypothetical protein